MTRGGQDKFNNSLHKYSYRISFVRSKQTNTHSSIFLPKHSTGYSIIATLKKLYTILMTFFLFRATILPSFLPYAHSSALKSKQANPLMVALWTSSVSNLILIKWKLVSLRTNTISHSKQFYQPSLLESPLTRILRVW